MASKHFATAFAAALLTVAPVAASAEMVTQTVVYEQGGTKLEGYLAYEVSPKSTLRPAVLVFHEWKGLGDYAKRRARELAALGYVAFAADVYGQGVRPQSNEEAGKTASIYRQDRALMRARAQAAFDRLAKEGFVDKGRIAAIGYCFGGTVALELARSGAPLAATVSFHGGLDTPRPADAKNIKGPVLVLHGAVDPAVPPEQVAAFEKEMTEAKVDWQLVSYGGAVHAFTNPEAGERKPDDPTQRSAYDAKADKRSWEHMRIFFQETLPL